jgi:hypothetical protein
VSLGIGVLREQDLTPRSSLCVSLEVLGLGQLDLWRVVDGEGSSSHVGDGCGVGMGMGSIGGYGDGDWGGSNWEVSSGNSESVDGVRDVVGGLEETVGIDVGICTARDPVSSSGLRLGRWTTGVSVRVLPELILGVVLGRGRGGCDSNNSRVGRVGQWGADETSVDRHEARSKNDLEQQMRREGSTLALIHDSNSKVQCTYTIQKWDLRRSAC